MNLTDIPLMAMLKGKMAYLSQRQSVIAQNVANADTPGYVPRDMKAFAFEQVLGSGGFPGAGLAAPTGRGEAAGAPSVDQVSEMRTNPMHLQISPPGQGTRYGNQIAEDSEVRLDGNHVVLEEQMVKLTNSRLDYDAAVGFYQKSMSLLTSALKRPGT